LNSTGSEALTMPTSLAGMDKFFYVDINGDQFIAPNDVLRIINFFNEPTGDPEGESTLDAATPIPAVMYFSNVNSPSVSPSLEAAQIGKISGSAASRIATQQPAQPGIERLAPNAAREFTPTRSHDEGYARALDELFQDDSSPLLDLFFE
jgi:hypothetical protein